MTVLRRYSLKLYPTPAQDAALERQTVLLARLWNAALEQREQLHVNLVRKTLLECLEAPSSVIGSHPSRKGQVYVSGDLQGPREKPLNAYSQSKFIKPVREAVSEFDAMSAHTPAQCITALDDAFKAFFKRAKGGAGASSGYPRFKASKRPDQDWRAYHHDTIWHRFLSGCGIDQAGKNWRVYAKGIPGTIKARGKFPVDLSYLELRDMRIMRRDSAWHCSISVRMDERARGGNAPVRVTMDLIDEFARVENRANGQCLPGWEGGFQSPDEQIARLVQGDSNASADDAPEMGGDDRIRLAVLSIQAADDAPEMGGDDRSQRLPPLSVEADAAPEMRGDDRKDETAAALDTADAAPEPGSVDEKQSAMDSRYRKGSWRWREERRQISKRQARDARRRKEARHRATTALVRQAAEIEVVCPPIKEFTKSARGNERAPGAAVKTVAMLNRHVLAQAPAETIQMLEYKAAEAGIPFARIEPAETALAIGRDLPAATKAARRAAKSIRKADK